jgi:hypothetical protein
MASVMRFVTLTSVTLKSYLTTLQIGGNGTWADMQKSKNQIR